MHLPATDWVKTPYWLKLDLDVVATGQDDWIDERWFEGNPAIIAHPWNYSKPPESMLDLDKWVKVNAGKLPDKITDSEPLNLIPNPGSDIVRHERIISFCGFFNTEFTKLCSEMAESTCGSGKLPVPSQDGFMWYVAKRGGFGINRVNMKARGWKQCSSERSILQSLQELKNGS